MNRGVSVLQCAPESPCISACVCTLDLAPDPLTAAADGLHHRYAERGTGGKGYYFVTKDRCQRWNFNATIGLQPCGNLNIH